VLILENVLYDEEQKLFSKQMWEVLLTNERKNKEKSKNSASRRHWKSVKGLNRTLFQACGSICYKSKLGRDMKFFYFHCNFQPH